MSLQIEGLEILSAISSGGMGEVYLARRHGAHGFEKLVAVKTIRSELTRRVSARAMFLDEARLLSRMTHPAVAQIYDFGKEEGALYIVKEYVAGVSFSRLVDAAIPHAWA